MDYTGLKKLLVNCLLNDQDIVFSCRQFFIFVIKLQMDGKVILWYGVKNMLIISLDEYGEFERFDSVQDNDELSSQNCSNAGCPLPRLQRTEKPVFIAGIVFDDCGESGEEKAERKRIEAYYRAVIRDASRGNHDFIYPSALHSNIDPTHVSVVREVKPRVDSSLGEFIKFGTYNRSELTDPRTGTVLQERKGKYYVFAILKSAEGMRFSGDRFDDLTRDSYASNLYFHMVHEFVTHMLFANPLLDCLSDLKLNLATRVTPNLPVGSSTAKKYLNLGYKPLRKNQKGETVKFEASKLSDTDVVFFELANADIYRALIAQETTKRLSSRRVCDFRVDSINYKKSEKMEFLYLSDSVCSNLSYDMSVNSEEGILREIENRIKNLSDCPLLFGYDSVDTLFMKAWDAYSCGDYYTALACCFESEGDKNAFAKYYRENWFSIIKHRIVITPDAESFCNAVYRLRNSTFSNKSENDLWFYIFDILQKAVPNVKDKLTNREDKRVLFILYDTGITVYNHRGESRKAAEMFEKVKQYREYVGVDYLFTLNKRVVSLNDEFQYQEAKKLADETIECWDWISEPLMHFYNNDYYSSDYAKALSTKGQVLSNLRDNQAEDMFKKAMKILTPNSYNYRITQSYLLHHYIDVGKETEYRLNAEEYFGGHQNINEQLKYIVDCCGKNEPPIAPNYALYVFLKGVYVFENIYDMPIRVVRSILEADKKILKKTRKSEMSAKDQERQGNGHPWELIRKYQCLIAKKAGIQYNDYFEEMQKLREEDGSTVNYIIDYAEIEITDSNEEKEKKAKDLFRSIKKQYNIFADLDESVARDALDNIFTFMYR